MHGWAVGQRVGLYLAERNKAPKPYRWYAAGEEILAKIERAVLESVRNRR